MGDSGTLRSVLITGGCGNLGGKLVAHCLALGCGRVIALDRPGAPAPSSDPRLSVVGADLADPTDSRWRDAFDGIDAVVHLAARNPNPDAPWEDATASFDMTLRLLEAAAASGVRRFVFASSNHVMGQYKDPPLADGLRPGALTTDRSPGPGTRWFTGEKIVQGTAYAVSKLMGERASLAKAAATNGTMTSVCVRIGWCQPGDNDPKTINAAGVTGAKPRTDPDAPRDLHWFRSMWLSNRDFLQVMEKALSADSSRWPAAGIIVNGMSRNLGMPWDLESARELIGYDPQDDVWRHVLPE